MSILGKIAGAAAGASTGVTQARAIMAGVMVAALLGFALWVHRVDQLRAKYHGYADQAVAALTNAGFKNVKPERIGADIGALAKDRDTAHDNWAAADATIGRQSNSITALHAQTNDLIAKANARAKQIEAVTAQRDKWIAEARKAETRTDKMSAAAEVAECDYVLDQLYKSGF